MDTVDSAYKERMNDYPAGNADRENDMKYVPTEQELEMRVEYHCEQYQLLPGEREKIEGNLQTLRKLVSVFPKADLHIHIEGQSRSKVFHVKTALHLPKRTLFTGEKDKIMHLAVERCIRRLMNKVVAYKARMDRSAVYGKHEEGTLHDVVSTQEPDFNKLEKAVREGDFAAFRDEISVYDGGVSRSIGRWIQRYPDAQEKLGKDFVISELMDEVYLNAFEQYGTRSPDVRLGEWMENFIDPAVRAIVENPEVKKNISFIESVTRE